MVYSVVSSLPWLIVLPGSTILFSLVEEEDGLSDKDRMRSVLISPNILFDDCDPSMGSGELRRGGSEVVET